MRIGLGKTVKLPALVIVLEVEESTHMAVPPTLPARWSMDVCLPEVAITCQKGKVIPVHSFAHTRNL